LCNVLYAVCKTHVLTDHRYDKPCKKMTFVIKIFFGNTLQKPYLFFANSFRSPIYLTNNNLESWNKIRKCERSYAGSIPGKQYAWDGLLVLTPKNKINLSFTGYEVILFYIEENGHLLTMDKIVPRLIGIWLTLL